MSQLTEQTNAEQPIGAPKSVDRAGDGSAAPLGKAFEFKVKPIDDNRLMAERRDRLKEMHTGFDFVITALIILLSFVVVFKIPGLVVAFVRDLTGKAPEWRSLIGGPIFVIGVILTGFAVVNYFTFCGPGSTFSTEVDRALRDAVGEFLYGAICLAIGLWLCLRPHPGGKH